MSDIHRQDVGGKQDAELYSQHRT